MIKDKPNRIVPWLMLPVEWFVLRNYGKLTYIGDPETTANKSVLVLNNHFSFNDGAVLHKLARKVFKKTFKVMVVEAQLKAFWALRYDGGFSINKKSRTVVESLNYAAALLRDPGNMVGIYPQGQVFSMHLNKIHFEKGLTQILKKSENMPFQIVFAITLLDYLDSFKPHARCYLLPYKGPAELLEMEKAYNKFYRECKIRQQELHGPPVEVIDETLL